MNKRKMQLISQCDHLHLSTFDPFVGKVLVEKILRIFFAYSSHFPNAKNMRRGIRRKYEESEESLRMTSMPRGGGGGGVGDTTPAILAGTKRTENSFGIIWPSPRQLRVKNTLRVGHRGPVGRKTTQKPPQNTKKFFHVLATLGKIAIFREKNQKPGYFLTSQSLLWHKYTPKVACESIPTCFGHI